MGVISTLLLSAGVLRHYYDIYIHRTVRGISFIFVGIDAAGDVFSLISVCPFSSRPHLAPPSISHKGSLSTQARYPRNGHLCHGVCSLVRRVCVRWILQSNALGSSENKE
jgi:hypothetical protein